MFKVLCLALSAAVLSLPVLAADEPAPQDVSVSDLNPGDRIELRGQGGQSYLLKVTAIRDGVLHARCLRSGSEFRGEISAISSVHRLTVSPEQDMAPVMALVGSGLDSSVAR